MSGGDMFKGCSSLVSLDMSGIGEVYGGDMFIGCNNLQTFRTPQKISENGSDLPLPGVFSSDGEIYLFVRKDMAKSIELTRIP